MLPAALAGVKALAWDERGLRPEGKGDAKGVSLQEVAGLMEGGGSQPAGQRLAKAL
jgi:hypothetical protein